jgi:RNA polymerase sigma-70 factor (sigma-E family)
MLSTRAEGASTATGGRLADLYLRHADGAVRLAYLLTGDRQVAEDIVQDAFVKVVGRFGHLRSGSSFEAYLRRTIVNLTKNTWRRRSVERAHQADALPELRDVEAADGAVVERMMVLRTLRSLPERQRTAIVLRFYEDLPEGDIASIMRCPAGTVRSLISRGVAAMREQIGGERDA